MARKQIATFLGTQKGLSIVGDHCYAYSGVINADGETTYLEFVSPKEYLIVNIQALTDQANGDDFDIRFYLNGMVVGVAHAFFYSNSTYVVGAAKWDLVIPPLTTLKVTVQNSGTADEWSVMLTGRVYDA